MKPACLSVLAALLTSLTVVTAGCGSGGGSAGDQQGRPAAEAGNAGADQPSRPNAEQPQEVEGEASGELSAAHILIMHRGSERAPASVTRSQVEALALAQEVAEKAREPQADFASLARQYSDGPSGPRGGSLGNFMPEQMVKPFSDATMKLSIGDVSDPVETQFGYHIIRRQPIQVIAKASAKHILVMYKGSMRAPESIQRSKEEAHARINECLTRVKQGERFEDLAREYSDGPTGPNGGDLGEFQEGMMAPTFDKATFECEVGQTTGVVETPFGYHIIYRYK